MEEIQRMQDNLLLIRRTIGWTAAAFGNQIGVTRQTINNIESGRNKLTKTQYIAMRSVIDAELVKHPEETQMVKTLLDMLIDHPENYSKADYNELIEKANLMSPSILAGTATRETVSKEWMKAAGAIGAVVASTVAVPLAGFFSCCRFQQPPHRLKQSVVFHRSCCLMDLGYLQQKIGRASCRERV